MKSQLRSFHTLFTLLLGFATNGAVHGGKVGMQSGELLHNAQLQFCPQSCEFTGPDPANWTSYHDPAELTLCKRTVLFTLNVQNLISDPETHVLIKACSVEGGGPRMTTGEFIGLHPDTYDTNATVLPPSTLDARQSVSTTGNLTTLSSCGAISKKTTVPVHMAWSGSPAGEAHHISAAAAELARYFRNSASCGTTIMFASAGDAILGAHAGGDLVKSSAANLIEKAKTQLDSNLLGQLSLQVCPSTSDNGTISSPFGIFVDLRGDVAAVQTALRTWANGDCLDTADLTSSAHSPASTVDVSVLTSPFDSANGNLNVTVPRLGARADCRVVQVVSGDSCASLATKCGISGNDFTKYNSYNSKLCSTLKVKQYVCCSSGTLPDMRPKPNPDGTCRAYTVQKNDGCWAIADSFGITQDSIEQFNKQTWGWAGCASLMQNQVICISSGVPPMPSQDSTMICGPQVVGTKRPAKWSDITNLNPCPLNACCNIWGQCGTTKEFCTPSPAKTGAPGTALPGTNGCISNCGTGIVNNSEKPASFSRVGYFEAWNGERPCLNMDISQFDTGYYTHVHFAFATITPDFKVNISGVEDQFNKMKKLDMKGTKKILSFGGWSFSTSQDSYPIFRNSVTPANRVAFAENAVQFLKDNNLDGLDFDWEYPGAIDIPEIDPGTPEEGDNYLAFLQVVRNRLPAGKTLSIAIPASFWYLRGFPVAKMAKVVDYFIYMTYDLHGQWDYDNKWSNPGCPKGNCLRSHVNYTETENALSMVTKAGVPSKQIMVGITSYGRSFKMADPKCTGPMCKFLSGGKPWVSVAEPGLCTNTSGYISDAELRSIQQAALETGEDGEVKLWHDFSSNSDIMTWNGNWVAYMSPVTKKTRTEWVKGINFGGISDWAVDLERFHAPPGQPDDEDDVESGGVVTPCTADYADLDAISNDRANIPTHCWGQYILRSLSSELDDVITKYYTVVDDYDGKFGYYAEYINDLVDPQLQTWMSQRPSEETDQANIKSKGNRFFDCKYKDLGAQQWEYEGPCPVPESYLPASWESVSYTIEFTLRDKDGFEKALQNELGMGADWIKWGTYDPGFKCPNAGHSDDVCEKVWKRHINFPMKADSIKVPNPKDVMTTAMSNITVLKTQILAAYLAVGISVYDGDEIDAVQALSTPVFMLEQAVASMETVKVIGEKVEDYKKKELILTIISAILMVLPMIGEIGLELAGFVQLARFAFLAGEIGNAAMSLVDIVENPESAPFAIMGMLMGTLGGGLKFEKTLEQAAGAKKIMSDADIGRMGKVFKEKDTLVSNVIKQCIR